MSAETNLNALDSAIGDDAGTNFEGGTVDDAVAALMRQWEAEEEDPAKAPASETDGEPETDPKDAGEEDDEGTDDLDKEGGEEDDEGEDGDDDDDGDEEDEDEGEQEAPEVSDDVEVKVTVDGKEQAFTVGQLKRLAGQEAALTRKSQEVANRRRQAETLLEQQTAALETMAERAWKRFEPYKDIDFNLAAQQYEPEVYKALREDAMSAFNDVKFYKEELKTLGQRRAEHEDRVLREQAAETVKTLQDPDKGIPGFSREMFSKLRDYALSVGAPEEVVNKTVDPLVWKLLHKAMQYDADKAQAARAAKPGKVVHKTGKQVVSAKRRSNPTSSKKRAAQKHTARLSNATGLDAVSAAADAFLAQWGTE